MFNKIYTITIAIIYLYCSPANGELLQQIGVGTTPNDHTGDSLRAACIKVNSNFTKLAEYIFYADPTQPNQWAATVAGNLTVKDFVDSNGASKIASIVLRRGSTGNNTDYTFLTSGTIPDNITLIIEPGARCVDAGGTANLVIGKMENPGPRQVFNWTGSGAVTFARGAIEAVYSEFWYSIGAWDSAIRAAFAAAVKGINVKFQAATYTINSEIFINGLTFNIYGVPGSIVDRTGTIWDYGGAKDVSASMLRVLGSYGHKINGLVLNCADLAGFGLRLEGDSAAPTPYILLFQSDNLVTANALASGLYAGEAAGGSADPMVEDLTFRNYNSYDNYTGLTINSQNSSSVIFLGGWFGSPHSGASNKCAYHVNGVDVYNVCFYGTQFTALGTTVGQRAIEIQKGACQIYGGYNEVEPFLRIAGGWVKSIVSGVSFPASSDASVYDIDYVSGPGISLDGVSCHQGKVRCQAGLLTINNCDIQQVVNDGEKSTPENIVLDPAMSMVSTDGYWKVTAATLVGETTIKVIGHNSAKITADGVNGMFYQDISVASGDRYSFLRGQLCTLGCYVYCSSANDKAQTLVVSDAITSFSSIVIPKDNQWHLIEVCGPISAAATNIRIGLKISGAVSDTDDVAYVNSMSFRTGYPSGQLLLGALEFNARSSWDPGAIADGDMESKNITVYGAEMNDFALASCSINITGLILTSQVTATNTVTCTLSNNTGAPIDLVNVVIRVRVIK